jgi:predicted transcriptional regulator of viral defense system
MKHKPAARNRRETLREELGKLVRASKAGLISHEDAMKVLGLDPRRTTLRLYSLIHRGWLRRVRRGLFLVHPVEAETHAAPTVEDPWILSSQMFEPCYIGGWSAAEHWDLTEQIFRSTFVVTARPVARSELRVHGMELHLVHARLDRVESVNPIWRGKERIRVANRERTIADGLVNPSWLGGIRPVADMLAVYRDSERWRPDRLRAELEIVGTGAAFKRLGYILEALHLEAEELVRTAERRRTTGIVKLEPRIAARGRLSKRWGLWVNATLAPTETA